MTLEIQKKLQEKFQDACMRHDLKTVKYLLDSPGLAKHIDVGFDDFRVLTYPIRVLDEPFIDCLLEHSKEKDQVHVKRIMIREFEDACWSADLNKLHFLYKNEKYKKYIDITNNSTHCFKCAYNSYESNYERRLDVLKFLILEVGLTRDDENIVQTMRNNGSAIASKLFRDTIDIFNKQKLPKILEEKLSVKEDAPVKPKLKI